MLGAVRCHRVPSDSREALRGDALLQAIRSDKEQGLIPFFVSIESSLFRTGRRGKSRNLR